MPLTQADVERVAVDFVGEIDQVPPMVSAIKVDGQRTPRPGPRARRSSAHRAGAHRRRGRGGVRRRRPPRRRSSCGAAAAPTSARWRPTSEQRSAVRRTSGRCRRLRVGSVRPRRRAPGRDRGRPGRALLDPPPRCRTRRPRPRPQLASAVAVAHGTPSRIDRRQARGGPFAAVPGRAGRRSSPSGGARAYARPWWSRPTTESGTEMEPCPPSLDDVTPDPARCGRHDRGLRRVHSATRRCCASSTSCRGPPASRPCAAPSTVTRRRWCSPDGTARS
jgi:hypothetical protein